MRTHRVAGSVFMAAGVALFVLGATADSAPGFLRSLPLPPEVVVPFVLWQLAVWSALFGLFFLRPRRRAAPVAALPRV